MRKITTFLFSVILFPIVLVLYVLDRLLLSVLIHLKSDNFSNWMSDKQEIKLTVIRVLVFYTILLVVYFLN
jgi:hypothetical protein